MYRALFSPWKLYEQVQYMLPTFFLIWYHDVTIGTRGPRRLATLSCMGTMLTTVKEGSTKVVNDLQVTKDRGTQTKTEAKRLKIEHYYISAITFLSTGNSITIVP